jgi:alpha-L-fucosidase
MRLICKARRANLLLDVPPDKHGLIPQRSVDALMRLAKNMEQLPERATPTEPR